VGSGAQYTAAVWLGNFDNQGAFDLVGADAAGPILFDLLEGMEPRRLPADSAAPAGLEWLEVCAYSGYLPGAACPTRKRVLAVRAAVPTRRCPYHVAVDVDLATGFALQPACRGGHRWETKSFVTWPASLRRWLGERQRWLPEPPPLAPGCEAPPEPGELHILSPPQGQVLVLMPGVPAGRQEVPLQGEVGGGGALSWFVDGEYLGSAPADQRSGGNRSPAATASPSSTPPAALPSASCRCVKASPAPALPLLPRPLSGRALAPRAHRCVAASQALPSLSSEGHVVNVGEASALASPQEKGEPMKRLTIAALLLAAALLAGYRIAAQPTRPTRRQPGRRAPTSRCRSPRPPCPICCRRRTSCSSSPTTSTPHRSTPAAWRW
jgi:hypothetical protein